LSDLDTRLPIHDAGAGVNQRWNT